MRYHAPMLHRRLRTFTLWTGTALCVLIAAAFVVSGFWGIRFLVPMSRGPGISVMAGSVRVVTVETITMPDTVTPHSYGLFRWNSWIARRASFGKKGLFRLEFPIYAVFLAVAIPTLLVWRFWPKPVKPGHCRCGYDLHGNESGVCPECGVEVQP